MTRFITGLLIAVADWLYQVTGLADAQAVELRQRRAELAAARCLLRKLLYPSDDATIHGEVCVEAKEFLEAAP